MEWLYVSLCLTAVQLVSSEVAREYIELGTRLGRVRGYRETVLGRQVDTFFGIPYAKPPLGNLRFQRPESYGDWPDTWDATKQPNACSQIMDRSLNSFRGVTMWNPNTNISEDCLYLNIWTPNSEAPRPLKAVMIWIFGGGFYGGSSTLDWYDGRIMASEGDVVVVSMQYRLGVMGFFYLGLNGAPGNMGLLDQQMAIQWVFNNIQYYGGDHNRITIFGESAGAASVSLHMLSPLSKATFQRAIMQSATALNPWALDSTAQAKKKSLDIASRLGCDSDVPEQVLTCMREASSIEITNKMWTIKDDSVLLTPVVPIVDGYFLREHPLDLVSDGNFKMAPILIGVNKDEGAYWLPFMLPAVANLSREAITTNEQYLQSVREILHSDDELTTEVVAHEYKYPYHYSQKLTYMDILDDIVGDFCFICPTVDYALTYSDHKQDVYFYQFNHITSDNPWPKWMGTLHGYELDTIFGLPMNDSKTLYTQAEKELAQRMIHLWTNFGKTGNPVLEEDGGKMAMTWPKFTPEARQYVVLNTTTPAPILDGLRDRKCKFWKEMYPILRTWEHPSTDPCHQMSCGSQSLLSIQIITAVTCLLLAASTQL